MNRAFMAYWMQHDLYKLADGGKYGTVVDNITKKINMHTESYDSRRLHFDSVKHLIA